MKSKSKPRGKVRRAKRSKSKKTFVCFNCGAQSNTYGVACECGHVDFRFAMPASESNALIKRLDTLSEHLAQWAVDFKDEKTTRYARKIPGMSHREDERVLALIEAARTLILEASLLIPS